MDPRWQTSDSHCNTPANCDTHSAMIVPRPTIKAKKWAVAQFLQIPIPSPKQLDIQIPQDTIRKLVPFNFGVELFFLHSSQRFRVKMSQAEPHNCTLYSLTLVQPFLLCIICYNYWFFWPQLAQGFFVGAETISQLPNVTK